MEHMVHSESDKYKNDLLDAFKKKFAGILNDEDLAVLLLVGAAEAEGRGVGSRVHLALAHHHEVLAPVRDLLPDRCARRSSAVARSGRRRRAATVSPTLQLAGVRLLLAQDHAEERRLPGPVRADDADDAAAAAG